MKLYKLIIRLLFNLDGLSPHHDFHHPKGLALFKAPGLPAVHSTQGRGSLIPKIGKPRESKRKQMKQKT